MVSLKGKIALVTGGSAGLGAAIVRKLAVEGCNVAINYSSSKDRAEALAKEVSDSHKIKAIVLQGDVSKASVCKDLVEATVAQLGGLDVVVSNAGWTRVVDFTKIDELEEEDFDRCYNMNVKAHFNLFRASKPHFDAAADGGVFLVSASVAGLKPGGSSIPYSLTKAASIHLVKCLAKSQGPKCRVNAVCPGLLLTEWGLRFGEERIKKMEQLVPLKFSSKIEDNADMFIALAKNSSATGAIVSVDSGMSVV
uniref:ARAD1C22110p n=1 Tax=Blastobotrys adeninivorans TaxID=409370 RepID=A0A060T171_BLAAD